MGLLVLITNLELRDPVSTFFLFPDFKRLWDHLRCHSAGMWNTVVPPVRSNDKNFLYFQKKKKKKPKALTPEGIHTLITYLHFYSGPDVNPRYCRAETVSGDSGRTVGSRPWG